MRIVHLTSAHPRYDTRVFLKECRGLAAHGHRVSLVVADGLGDEVRNGVEILDAGKSQGRLGRMVAATRRVLRRALDTPADAYHLHDPELIPAGVYLKLRGMRVIFDAHEDLPMQVLSKPYLRPIVRGRISAATAMLERHTLPKFDGVIAATPFIRDKFRKMGIDCIAVNNFPLLDELETATQWSEKQAEICYVGSISSIRGISQLVQAMDLLNTGSRLNLVGSFPNDELRRSVEGISGWSRVDLHGFLGREGVRAVLGNSMAGIVTFLPAPNHVNAQPNKMFEYMSAAIPVIASDFPLWREIIEGNQCGLCVDPLDPRAIASAIDYIISNPRDAQRMGESGRRAVLERYNWEAEEKKLLEYYDRFEGRCAA